MIRNKKYSEAKVLGKYNTILDGTIFQKAHYEVGKESRDRRKDDMVYSNVRAKINIIWNGSIANECEMIKNENKKK